MSPSRKATTITTQTDFDVQISWLLTLQHSYISILVCFLFLLAIVSFEHVVVFLVRLLLIGFAACPTSARSFTAAAAAISSLLSNKLFFKILPSTPCSTHSHVWQREGKKNNSTVIYWLVSDETKLIYHIVDLLSHPIYIFSLAWQSIPEMERRRGFNENVSRLVPPVVKTWQWWRKKLSRADDWRACAKRVNCSKEAKIIDDRIAMNAQMIEQLRFVCHDNIEHQLSVTMIDGVCPRSFVTQLDGKHDTITRRDKNRQTHGPSLSTKCQWNLLVVFAIRLKVMPRWTHKAQSSVTYFHWLTWTQPGRTPLISSEKRPSEIYFLQTTGWRLYQSGKRIPPLTSEIGL